MQGKISREEIINYLKSDKTFLSEKFGVISIGLFGSYAKGEEDMNSDIDLIVELKKPSFEWLAGLQIYLEKKFDRKIELIRKSRNVNRYFASRIEKEIIYA